MAPTPELLEKPPVNPIKAASASNGVTPLPALNYEGAEKHQMVLNVFRAFATDLCQQYRESHTGSTMGMAAIGIALYKYVMKYSPNYFNRDRFVLSNGHACLWQYLFMHLVGVKSMT